MRNKLILPLGIAAVGALLAVAIPNYIKARVVASESSCIQNLKAIQKAKAKWAKENKVTNEAEPQESDLFGPSKYMRDTPACFLGGTYSMGKVSEPPRCSRPEHSLGPEQKKASQ